jgi:iron complex transport system substrate-binding protein
MITARRTGFFLVPLLVCMIFSCGGKNVEKITDRGGNTIVVPQKKDRIISAMPSNTEILVDLGLADRLVAVDKYSKDIEGVDAALPALDIMYPDVEFIVSLNPDIIIAHGMSHVGAGDDPFAALRSAGISVIYLSMSNSIEGIYGDIAFLANLFDMPERGEAIIANMKADIEKIAAVGKTIQNKKTVYFEINPAPSITSFGRDTYLNEMIELTGAVNIFANEKGILFPTLEEILMRNPDVMMTNVNFINDAIGNLVSRPGFEYVNAVKNGAVFYIDANSSSRPTNHIIKALDEMARDIYPEYYAAPQ